MSLTKDFGAIRSAYKIDAKITIKLSKSIGKCVDTQDKIVINRIVLFTATETSSSNSYQAPLTQDVTLPSDVMTLHKSHCTVTSFPIW